MKKSLLVLAIVSTLSACGESPAEKTVRLQQEALQSQIRLQNQQAAQLQNQQVQQVPVQQYAPQVPVIIAAPQSHDSTGTALAAGAMGYMLGQAGNNSNRYNDRQYESTNRTVVNKTIINRTVVVNTPAPLPVVPPKVYVPTYTSTPNTGVNYAVKPPTYKQPTATPTYKSTQSYSSKSTYTTKSK